MFEWVKDKFLDLVKWLQLKIAKTIQWLQNFFTRHQKSSGAAQTATGEDEIDFSSYNRATERFHTSSFAKIYDMSAKRKWQWLRNLIFLKQFSSQVKNEPENAEILAEFSNKKERLAHTSLSFDRNPIPVVPGDAYINNEAVEEYFSVLAQHRHYHLFARVVLSMLRRNSVSTIDLLKNLLHARDQLNENHFFDEDFALLYVKDKSQQWIGSLVYRILPKEPTEIIEVDVDVRSPAWKEKNILLCDDICYSGTQICRMLDSFENINLHHYLDEKTPRKEMKITLLFGRMSIYALAKVKEKIKEIEALPHNRGGIELDNAGKPYYHRHFEVNIIVGELFHTPSSQLDFLPFPPNKKERHIIKQVLESDYSEHYTLGDFRRIPLLTTAWKKPDYVSSYSKFLGFEKKGPNATLVSAALLARPPSAPITWFSPANSAPSEVQVSKAFISGPQPPYKPL